MNKTPTKKLDGKVVWRQDKTEKVARIKFEPFDGEPEFYNLWRMDGRTKQPTPAESKCAVGAEGRLVLKFKRGGPKVEGDPSKGFWPDEWTVVDFDPLATGEDARSVDGPVKAPGSPVDARLPQNAPQSPPRTQTDTDRDALIVAQVAWKVAGELGTASEGGA